MILAIDVGNTETMLGLFKGREAVHCWRISTQRHPTGDEMSITLGSLLESAPGGRGGAVERAVIASVVPQIDRSWEQALQLLRIPFIRIDGRTPLPVRLDVEEPFTVGADRIANTLAASCLFGRNTVVVDLGTATTFDCITSDGVFLGGVIAPGPRAGIERLHEVASKLPAVDIRRPETVIGRYTEACLESGVFYTLVEGIDGVVRRIIEEWAPEDPLVIATGGLAEVLAPHCRTVERIDPLLTLLGLVCADEHLRAMESGA